MNASQNTSQLRRKPRKRQALLFVLSSEMKRAPRSAQFGMAVIALYALIAVFAPLIAPYGESEIVSSFPYGQWSASFPLGTDQLGRDVLTRLIYGARNTIGIALAATILSFFVGGVLGILVSVVRGWLDQLLSRAVDALIAIPALIFALILLSVFGTSILNLIIIIAVLDATRVFRLARSVAMNVAMMDFVEAARLRGESLTWIVGREILPNILPTLVTEMGLRFAFVFLTISALSFLGLGIQPPTADWGSMVRESAALISYGDIAPLLPAACIALLTVAVNYVVDWIIHRTSGLPKNG